MAKERIAWIRLIRSTWRNCARLKKIENSTKKLISLTSQNQSLSWTSVWEHATLRVPNLNITARPRGSARLGSAPAASHGRLDFKFLRRKFLRFLRKKKTQNNALKCIGQKNVLYTDSKSNARGTLDYQPPSLEVYHLLWI